MTQPSTLSPIAARHRPTRLKLASVSLLIGLLGTACSSSLSHEDAQHVAQQARQLYPDAFVQRAPVLTQTPLAAALGERISRLPDHGPAPTRREWLRADAPRFVAAKGPTPNAGAIEQLCTALPQHNLEVALFPCDAYRTALAEVDRTATMYNKTLATPDLSAEDLERLQVAFEGRPTEQVYDVDGAVRPEVLLDAMFGGASAGVLVRPAVELEQLGKVLTRHAEALADVEVLAHQILLQFAWELRGRWAAAPWKVAEEHRAWLNALADREERRSEDSSRFREAPPEGWPATAEDAELRPLVEAMARLDREGATEAITGLYPAGDQYVRLVKARAAYQGMVARGGFDAVPATLGKFKRGKPHDALPALRRRLAQEGYLDQDRGQDPSLQLDDATRSALSRFQRAHQLADKGLPDKPTVAALNVSADRRLAQVELAMSRWRQVAPRSGYWVQVNLPDFHGEVWRDGMRQHRFKVVVGNATRKYKDGKRQLVNATPLIQASIDRVIYNPYWNIPDRILTEEVMKPEVAELPTEDRAAYFSDRGYELMHPGTEWESVRQLPGPGNALGQVKIIFPNPHDVYLHDTASRKLFDLPVRAFSHGCMRVHKPLELARLLLENDGQYDEREVESVLRRHENRPIFLKQKVPVYIDYITVHVDDDGAVRFGADIYDYDAPLLEPSR